MEKSNLREKAETLYKQLHDLDMLLPVDEVDIGKIEDAFEDVVRQQQLDELSNLGQCAELHIWRGHPEYERLQAVVTATEAWYKANEGTMASQSPTGLKVREALINLRAWRGLQAGIADAKAGRIVDGPQFTEYANDVDE